MYDGRRGALIGLAVGDALGAAVEFKPPGSFAPVTGYRNGGPHRLEALPDVPTFAEAGLPGAEATNWWGIVAPAGTPAAVLDRLQRDVAAILDAPETQKRFQHEGVDVLRMTREQFGQHIAAETTKWTQVVKQAGIKAE